MLFGVFVIQYELARSQVVASYAAGFCVRSGQEIAARSSCSFMLLQSLSSHGNSTYTCCDVYWCAATDRQGLTSGWAVIDLAPPW